MKYIIVAILMLIACTVSAFDVKNTGSTSRDSICIDVFSLDSLGKGPSTADSFYVRVKKSGSNAVVFSDSGTTAMTGMDSISGKSEYYYHRLVSDIDGSGAEGQYVLTVIAVKTYGSRWPTPNTMPFQIRNFLSPDSIITKQIKVASTTDTAVSISTSASAKPALTVRSTNASSGYGAYIMSKANDALYLDAQGSGGVYGLHSKSTGASGGGGFFEGDNVGMIATGGAGSTTLGGASNSADFGSSATFNNATIFAYAGLTGTMALTVDSTSNASWFKTYSGLTIYPDSAFNGRLVYVQSSSRTNPRISGEVSRVVFYDSVGTGKSNIWNIYPPFSQAPAIGDIIVVYPLYSTSPTMVKDTIGSITVGDVTLAAGQFTKIKDTVNIAANIVAARDSAGLGVRKDSSGLAYRVDSSGLSVRKDSSGLAYRSQPDSITQKQAKIILGDTTKRVFPGILNDTTKRIKFSNDSVVAIDPIRTVAATVAGGATSAALQVAQDSLNALTAITRADSNLTKAVRDTAHIIDSIVKLILPLATQARDTLLTFPTWLAARFDTMMVAAGWADSSRTTNTYLNDADTVRVYKGENLWFKYIRLHPAHVPGYRPDSTRGRGW